MNVILEKCKVTYDTAEALKAGGKYFYHRLIQSPCENHVICEGREMIMMACNNYLGFATHPKVKEAATAAVNKYGMSTGGSRLICGTTEMHLKLEERLAKFYQTEATIIFPSGYQCVMGSISVLAGKQDLIINDYLNHASILEGAILSGAKTRTFMHNDMEDLDDVLSSTKNIPGKLVIGDSVFSMDGDIINLPEMYKVAKKHDALLMLDEAHGMGVIGETGRGAPEYFGLQGKIDIISGTFSKFAGAIGGFTASTKEVVSHIRHTCRSYLFSAAPPVPQVAGILAAFDLLDEEPQWLQRLWENTRFFTEEMKRLGFDLGFSKTPCNPIMIRDQEKTIRMNQILHANGIFAIAILFPAVAMKETRIRLGIMATHTREDLEKAIEIFKKAGKEVGII